MKSPDTLFLTDYTTEQSIEKISSSNKEMDWIQARRIKAFQTFKSIPIDQDTLFYKYTDFKKFDPSNLKPFWEINGRQEMKTEKNELEDFKIDIKTVDGKIEKEKYELENGIFFGTIQALAEKNEELVKKIIQKADEHMGFDKLGALSKAFSINTLVLYVPKGVKLERPVIRSMVAENSGIASFHEMIIYMEEESELTFVEDFSTSTNPGNENLSAIAQTIILNANARLNHVQFQNLATNHVFVLSRIALLSDYSKYTTYSQLQGSEMTKINSKMLLEGRGSEGYDLFSQFGIGNQRIDVKSELVHVQSDTIGQTHSRTVMVDKAESVLRGLIQIPKTGKNADSWLTSHGLTVGRGQIVAIPALMIDQNEVVAAHSASVEPLNQEKLFYVESRGIPKEEAKAILIKGYFEPLIKYIEFDELKDYARKLIADKWNAYSN